MDYLKILTAQKKELERMLGSEVLPRSVMSKIDLQSPLAQVVLGMRRAGKSVVCRTALWQAKVAFGYVNFDDDALANLRVEDLEDLLQALYAFYGEVDYLLFDEIQNVEGWHLFVNRLLRNGKHVVLTGSNAKLLDTELATHLTGRYLPIEVLPFSFTEYRAWREHLNAGVSHQLPKDYETYLFDGGLPETLTLADVRAYVSTLYNAIITKDIFHRHSIRFIKLFRDAAYVIMQQFAREISYKSLSEKLGIASQHTVQTYVQYLCEAYLVYLVRKFSFKPSERIRNEKVYVSDPAFISYFSGVLTSDEEKGWRLENLVFLELMRRRHDTDSEIFYYRTARIEVDFALARFGKVEKLVQVSYDINNPKTRKRELNALLTARRELRCDDLWLITDHQEEDCVIDDVTVHICRADRWLMRG